MIKLLKKLRRNPSKVLDYLVGNYRMFIYTYLPFLLRNHIKEQYKWRLELMNETCLDNRECIICGCKTPNLQFSNKSCEGLCYPPMISKKIWNLSKKNNIGILWVKPDKTVEKYKHGI